MMLVKLPVVEYYRERYSVSTDKSRLDVDAIHAYLANESYWSPGIPRSVVNRAIENSLCFGVYSGDAQAGFARVVSDFSSFAYLMDVFVLTPYRRRGLGKWLVECILDYPELKYVRNWMLSTWDVHELYSRYGFTPLANPEFVMVRRNPDVFVQIATAENST
jgi:GNAT superfamily N-acetyltransferase